MKIHSLLHTLWQVTDSCVGAAATWLQVFRRNLWDFRVQCSFERWYWQPWSGGAGTEALHSWGHEQVKSRQAGQNNLLGISTSEMCTPLLPSKCSIWSVGLLSRLCYNKVELKCRNQKSEMNGSEWQCGEQNTRSPSSLNTGLFFSNEQDHHSVKSLARKCKQGSVVLLTWERICWLYWYICKDMSREDGTEMLMSKRFGFGIGWRWQFVQLDKWGCLGRLWALLNCHVQFWNNTSRKVSKQVRRLQRH